MAGSYPSIANSPRPGLLLAQSLHKAGIEAIVLERQTELTRDLMDVRQAAGLSTVYEAGNVTVRVFPGGSPA